MRLERSEADGKQKAIADLRHDILNSVHHIFGHHGNCSVEFSRAKQKKTESDAADVTLRYYSENIDVSQVHHYRVIRIVLQILHNRAYYASFRYYIEYPVLLSHI